MIIDLLKYKLDVNLEETKQANEQLAPVNEQCLCDGCQNYAVAIESVDQTVVDFFNKLGINNKHSSEVYDFFLPKDNTCQYGGFYHIVGKIIDQKEELFLKVNDRHREMNENMVIHLTSHFSVWFSADCSLVPDGFPEPNFQMEINAILPWALDYPYLETHVSWSEYDKIKETEARLISKNDKRTLTGMKYILLFGSKNKNIKLIVEKRIFDYFDEGWTGTISYVGKKLVSVRI